MANPLTMVDLDGYVLEWRAQPGAWIGFDLDGTLAEYRGWRGPEHIGPPILQNVRRVQLLLTLGIEVRIFTARVYCVAEQDPRDREQAVRLIEEWCLQHIGQVLPVTCQKDFGCVQIWDDRAVAVEPNTGRILGGM